MLELVRLDGDVFGLGLRSAIRPEPMSSSRTGCSRRGEPCSERLADEPRLARLVEPFDPERYNTNASLAENLLFGSPVGTSSTSEQIADQPYVRETLERPACWTICSRSAFGSPRPCSSCSPTCRPTMSISASSASSRPEDLPVYRSLLTPRRSRHGSTSSAEDDQRPAAGADLQADRRPAIGWACSRRSCMDKVLAARRYFREHLPRTSPDAIAFFDPTQYNEAITIQDNMIFGKIAYGQAQAPQRSPS